MLKKMSGILLAVLLLFGVTACGNSSGQATNIKLSEVVRSVFYAPQYVAIEQGFFKEQGLNVELTTAWGGDKAMTALLSNQADIALIGAETTIFVYQQGSPDLVVNFAQLTQRDGSFIVSRQKIDNFKWTDLKGKSLIGSRNGSMPEMVSEYVQRKNGINPKVDNTVIQNITFDNLNTAFASGTGDFYQNFEPGPSVLEQQGKGYVVASLGQGSDTLPYTVYMAKDSYLKKNPDTIQKFTNAVQKAENWMNTHSAEEVTALIKSYFPQVDDSILIASVARYQKADAWAKDPIIDQAEFALLQEIMTQAGELKATAPYNKLVNTEFAEKAKNVK